MGSPRELRTYDAAEANQVLPQVRRLVERLVEASLRMPDLDDAVKVARYRAMRADATEDDSADLERREAELEEAESSLGSAAIALEEMGIQLKDAREGLVDFLAYREGELVELCWKLGEERVAHWHRIGEGFQGRKPL
jgi:hypothetical protein